MTTLILICLALLALAALIITAGPRVAAWLERRRGGGQP